MRVSPRHNRDRDRQSSQRSHRRRPRFRCHEDRRQERRGPHRGPRLVARRRMARLQLLDDRTALRDQAARMVVRNVDARHRAQLPRLLAGLRSGRTISLLPVGAHVRSGVRRGAVRAVVSARGAPVPDRIARGPAAAVRSEAARRPRRRRADQGRHPRKARAERRSRVDLEGIARRVAAFPVREERYGQIAGAASDKVLWTVQPVRRRARARGSQGARRASWSSSTSRR